MANINLTPGERYTFGKLNNVSVITDSTDYAQQAKYIRNTLIITSSNSSILQLDDYGTNDPYIRFGIGPGTVSNWSIGIDNSDNGSFKINNASALSTGPSTALRIDTDENISIPGNISITGSFALGGIANTVTSNALYYNTTTKQVTYGLASGSGGGSTTPGGLDTQIQYNNAGVFGGVSTLTWDGTTLRVTGSFTGSLTGIASSGSSILISNTPSSAGTFYPVFVNGITGYRNALVDNSTFTYDTTTNTLTVTASAANLANTSSYINALNQNAYLSGSLTITGSLTISGSSTFINIGPAQFSGSVSSLTGYTGSLLGTASFAETALQATSATSTISSSFASTSISSSFAQTASYYTNALVPTGGEGAIQFTNGTGIAGNSRFTYNNTNNIVNINNGATLNATGSLQGTASVAISALTTRTSTNATYYPLFVDSANGVGAAETIWSSAGSITMNPASGSINATSITSSLLGTSSFALTSSYVNILNQNVLITSSLSVGTGSIGPNENTITLGARDASSEGGQIGFNAPGGTYTSASFIDNWQNKLRLLKGTNAGSTAEVASWDLQTLYMNLPGGAITMPARPAFRVTGSSGYNPTINTVLSGSGIGIDYNQGSYYNNTNGQFTCPAAGLYHVWYVGRTFNTSLASVALFKNNTGTPLAFWESNTNSGHFGVSAVVNMAVNDIITAKVTAGQVTFDGNDNWGVAYIG